MHVVRPCGAGTSVTLRFTTAPNAGVMTTDYQAITMELWPIIVCVFFGAAHCFYLLYLKITKRQKPDFEISKPITILSIIAGLILGLIFSTSPIGTKYHLVSNLVIFGFITPLALIGLVHFFFIGQLLFWLPIKGICLLAKKS